MLVLDHRRWSLRCEVSANARPCWPGAQLEDAQVVEIRENVFRLRLPMPATPPHVNVYLVRSSDGAVVIDAGWNTETCWAILLSELARIGRSIRSVRAALVTHGHLDHIGLVHRLANSGVPIWLHVKDRQFVLRWIDGGGMDALWRSFLVQTGLSKSDIDAIREAAGRWQVPERVAFAARFPEAVRNAGVVPVWTPGHTPGHTCFILNNLVFTGDHLLPDVTPNIPRHGRSAPNPLGDYLRSLSTIEGLRPDLVLPGHGDPFGDVRDRIEEIRLHHRIRSDKVLQVLDPPPRSARDVAARMSWKRGGFDALGPLHKELAIYETAAHLTCLEAEGMVASKDDPSGIVLYSRR